MAGIKDELLAYGAPIILVGGALLLTMNGRPVTPQPLSPKAAGIAALLALLLVLQHRAERRTAAGIASVFSEVSHLSGDLDAIKERLGI
jgi:hypothetical protein